jgi:hypothetical protein
MKICGAESVSRLNAECHEKNVVFCWMLWVSYYTEGVFTSSDEHWSLSWADPFKGVKDGSCWPDKSPMIRPSCMPLESMGNWSSEFIGGLTDNFRIRKIYRVVVFGFIPINLPEIKITLCGHPMADILYPLMYSIPPCFIVCRTASAVVLFVLIVWASSET